MFPLNSEKVNIPSKSHQQKPCVQALLTDLYQITMAYSYWKAGKTKNIAVFDLFFRKNPFQGEFTIFAGLEECIQYLEMFHFSDSDIEYLKQQLPPTTEDKFFEFLSQLTAKDVTVHAFDEGTVTFPRVPLLRLEGPLIIVQLLETTLLTMVNFSSLIATNAARYRIAAGNNLSLIEIGLRRAQGPNGALSASKYSYIGGFDGTSNVLAGKIYNIPVKGTQVHSYMMSFSDLAELRTTTLSDRITGKQHDLLDLANKWREKLVPVFQIVETEDFNDSELAALISFAIAFPDGFFALINTYGGKKKYNCRMQRTANTQNTSGEKRGAAASPNGDCTNNFKQSPARSRANLTAAANNYTAIIDGRQQLHLLSEPYNHSSSSPLISDSSVRTGLLNFCAVALSLNDLGYRAVGIRLDNGDLSYLSNAARHYFSKIAETYQLPWFAHLMIMASNNINEETILSLNEQGHEINCFGIGTHLVTCQKQPALGCVYKMVEINGQARIKLSQELAKVTMPGRKDVYRLYSESGYALVDLLQRSTESPPDADEKVLCRHPFEESKRAYVAPAKIECMLKLYWQNGKVQQSMPSLEEIRKKVFTSLKTLRTDIKRNLNPTPFKVAVSDDLYNFIHYLWLENAPIGELS